MRRGSGPRHSAIFHHDATRRAAASRRHPDGRTTKGAPTTDAPPTILWLRRDVRLGDNPALLAASGVARERGSDLLPVFVWEPPGRRAWAPGAAARWWLARSLASLDADLRRLGSRLLLERGDPAGVVAALATASGAGTVVWASGLEPNELAADIELTRALTTAGTRAVVVPQTALLADPFGARTRDGRPYTVFTPFWRARLAGPAPEEPLPAPQALPPAPQHPPGLAFDELEPEASPAWADGFAEAWTPGERGAHSRLAAFLGHSLGEYAADRDRPDLDGSSRLSPHLHWGELTARQVWHGVAGVLAEAGLDLETAVGPPRWEEAQAPGVRYSAAAFLRQLGWREFGHHLLAAFPRTVDHPLRERFTAFPWRDDPAGLEAWRRGRTGYPIVDAAMRQLWTAGWLHNRMRLVAGSFLVKDLLLPWRDGAAWFWDTLVDADLANNTLGWQWVAGCGADAAPYFRVFNPVTQGRRFDPYGAYVRRWVPELAGLPSEYVQAPWQAPAHVLAKAGVVLGETYPAPLVDHGGARLRALAAHEAVRER
jgi:deoxyribodipyrimidine photo-lyase